MAKSSFFAVRMEVKMIRIRSFHNKKGRFGLQVHVESIPVWIACVDLEIFSSEKGTPKWYFEELYFLN
jgi:hypothetical protein